MLKIIQKQEFVCVRADLHLDKLSACHRLVMLVCLFLVSLLLCSTQKSFFRLNLLRKVRKRCSQSSFSCKAIFVGFFFTKPAFRVEPCFSVAMDHRPSHVTQEHLSEIQKIKSNFVWFCSIVLKF